MKLNSYLAFKGNCREAMNFYKEILGGDFQGGFRTFADSEGHMPYKPEHADKIMHVSLVNKDFVIMASDNMGVKQGNNFSLSLDFAEDDKTANSIFSGLSENGFVIMPFEDVFWGGKFGMLTDQYGIQWMVSSL